MASQNGTESEEYRVRRMQSQRDAAPEGYRARTERQNQSATERRKQQPRDRICNRETILATER